MSAVRVLHDVFKSSRAILSPRYSDVDSRSPLNAAEKGLRNVECPGSTNTQNMNENYAGEKSDSNDVGQQLCMHER